MSRTLEQKIAEAEARLQRLKAKSRSLDTAQKVIVGAADVNRIQPLINELEKLPGPPVKPKRTVDLFPLAAAPATER